MPCLRTLLQRLRPAPGPAGALLALALAGPIPAARAFTELTTPLRLPLTWIPIHWPGPGPAPRKLGLYAALGGSRQPRLFEFDTGGAGFYPTYAGTGVAPTSPWWGDPGTDTGYRFDQRYDDGAISYRGAVVRTSVSLFAAANAEVPLFTAHDVLVGRTETINDHPLDPPFQKPPLEGAFWGDFGLALKPGKKGEADHGSAAEDDRPRLDSFIAQMRYCNGVRPGYRVHASSSQPWVQFGLGSADRPADGFTIALNPPEGPGPTHSPADVPYGNDLVISGLLQVRDGATALVQDGTGMILDTGAYATIHTDGRFPEALIDRGAVIGGAEVTVAAASLQGGGGLGPMVPFLQFTAGSTLNDDLVWVKKTGSDYLNTGLLPFFHYDVMVDLEDGTLRLLGAPSPPPVPAPVPLLAPVATLALARRLRRR